MAVSTEALELLKSAAIDLQDDRAILRLGVGFLFFMGYR